MVLFANSVADFTFGGAFACYFIRFVLSRALALGAIMLGIKLRKNKNAKLEAETVAEVEK